MWLTFEKKNAQRALFNQPKRIFRAFFDKKKTFIENE